MIEFMAVDYARIKNVINNTNACLEFGSDASTLSKDSDHINSCIDSLKANRFDESYPKIGNMIIDECIRLLNFKKIHPRESFSFILIKFLFENKKLIEETVRLGKLLKNYISLNNETILFDSLTREQLLMLISLLYIGRDSFDVEVPVSQEMTRVNVEEKRQIMIAEIGKENLLYSKIKELDKTFEKDEFIISQIKQKAPKYQYIEKGIKLFE